MSDSDLTVTILREIRDEIRTTRTELSAQIGQTNERLDSTNERLDVTNERLAVVEDTLKDMAGQQLLLTRYVTNVADRHDVAIDDLRDRVEKSRT
jgi:hypothetical protein